MAAIEYGSYCWRMILNGKEQSVPGESVLLLADELAIDRAAAFIFKSAGRRPAGAEPQQNNGKNSAKNSAKNDQKGNDDEKDDKHSKDGAKDKEESMIYLAFAPGSWSTVYAAKLQDVASLTADLKVKRESLAATPRPYEDAKSCGASNSGTIAIDFRSSATRNQPPGLHQFRRLGVRAGIAAQKIARSMRVLTRPTT
jgi:hypothetical protein